MHVHISCLVLGLECCVGARFHVVSTPCAACPALCPPAVERVGSSTAPSPARLLVGSLHDDAMLLCRSLALEQFPSPLVLRTRTQSPVKRGDAPLEASSLGTCIPGEQRWKSRGHHAFSPIICHLFPLPRPARMQVVASVVHERLVGVDVAVRTTVPPGVRLQGQACQAAKMAAAGVPEAAAAQEGWQVGDGGGTMPAASEPAQPDGTTAAPHSVREPRKSARGAPGRAVEAAGGKQQPAQKQGAAKAAPGRQAAAAAPAPPSSPHTAGPPAPALHPTAAAAAATTRPKGKWRAFTAPPEQQQAGAAGGGSGPGGQPQGHGGPLQQISIQAALQRGGAATQSRQPTLFSWKQQKQASTPAAASLQGPAGPGPGLGLAAPVAAGQGPEACQPSSHAAMGQPGGPFSQFALHSSSRVQAGGGASGVPLSAGLAAGAGAQAVQPAWLRRGLLGGPPPAAPVVQSQPFAAGMGEAAGKRRKLAASLAAVPARAASVPSEDPPAVVPAAAPTRPAAAPAPPPETGKVAALSLPKLNWLSGMFGPVAAQPAAPSPTPAVAAAEQAPPDFAPLFSFL